MQAHLEIGKPAFTAIHGTVIHSLSSSNLEILPNALLVISSANGRITTFERDVAVHDISATLIHNGHEDPSTVQIITLSHGSFLIPGLIDTHNHAPQWAQRGYGRGKVILDWLNDITFPHEAKFVDDAYARRLYAAGVEGTLAQGTTTAVVYGSLHLEATKILAEICLARGQRALIGKCCMDRKAPEWYVEPSAEQSLRQTEEFIDHVRNIDPEFQLVTPVITPRFAISCTPELLTGLGELARKYPKLPIQTHFEETQQEVSYTKHLYPQFKNEAELWSHFGLLTSRSILGHCIYCEENTIEALAKIGCGVTHCPISTISVGDFGVAPIRQYLKRGVKVGLGTDIGGGYSSSILDAIRYAAALSTCRARDTDGKDEPLSIAECFFLATLGGAQVCGLDDKIGNFVVGKDFDALEIRMLGKDDCRIGRVAPLEDGDSSEEMFEKFLMTGDDRNISKVWVRGKLVKE